MTSINFYHKKYGGDFELDINWLSNTNNLFFSALPNLLFFDTGRSALLNILRNISHKKVLLPNYICQSIVDVFLSLGAEIEYFSVNQDMTINLQDLSNKICSGFDVLFFVNYFGHIQSLPVLSKVQDMAKKYNITIIEDTTHSIFSQKFTIGDYCIASLRKWFALPDGAVAYSFSNKMKDYSENNINAEFSNIRKQAMELKFSAIKNKSNDESYLKYFQRAEKCIENQQNIYTISDYSLNILKFYKYELMKKKRRDNFLYLEQNIKNDKIRKIIKYDSSNVYLFYPIYIRDRENFRQYLFENNIFCPVHWPLIQQTEKNIKYYPYDFQKNIISLIVDQRYTQDDMQKMTNIINQY